MQNNFRPRLNSVMRLSYVTIPIVRKLSISPGLESRESLVPDEWTFIHKNSTPLYYYLVFTAKIGSWRQLHVKGLDISNVCIKYANSKKADMFCELQQYSLKCFFFFHRKFYKMWMAARIKYFGKLCSNKHCIFQRWNCF